MSAENVTQANGAQAQQSAAVEKLDATLTAPVQFLVNGAIVSNQAVPPTTLLWRLCRVMGRVVGACTASGPLAQQLSIRAKCKTEFEAGMAEVTLQPLSAKGPAETAIPKTG